MTSKTVAERLRDAVKTRRRCDVDIIGNALGRIVICDSEKPCFECEAEWFSALADAIEAEYAEAYNSGVSLGICKRMGVDIAALDLLCDKLECGGPDNQRLAKQIRKAMNGAERSNDGVDVDALLKLADHFERMGNDSLAWARVTASDLHRWKARIRDALKGAKPQLPEGVIWPTYEDGELVKPFDKLPGFDSGGVQKFIWTSSHNGAWQLQDAEGHMLNVMHGEPVKRPESEVLGADGVPIKVGDTVYHEVDGSELTVVGFRDEKEDGEVMVDVEGKWFCVRQFSLTHRKPDTFKSVVEEMLTDFDSHDTIELDGYFARLRVLMGGE